MATTETLVLEQAVQLLLQKGNELFSCPPVVVAAPLPVVKENCTPFNSPVTGVPDSDPNPFGKEDTVLEKDGLDDDFFELV